MTGTDGGGFAARRAVLRWALRSFRREWRQQLLVLGLLAASIAAAIGFSTATYNVVGVPENSVFGSANHRFGLDDADPAAVAAASNAASEALGGVETIGEWEAPVPGSVESILYRAQDPDGAFAGPMLAIRDGRAPTEPNEVAVTDGVASTLQLTVGGQIDLDGHARTIVGVAENPSDLDEEFALVATSQINNATSFTLLIGGIGEFDEVRRIRDFGRTHLPGADLSTRPDVQRVQAAAAVVGTAAVVLVLVSLVASAAFFAIAHRRLRQLGMLSAVGATQRHMRLMVLANGTLVGLFSALLGAVVGLAGWFVAAPNMEAAAGFRIDPWNVPWALVIATVVAALATSTAAAWLPARSVATLPTTHALSGRPATPQPVQRSTTLGALLALGGVGLLLIVNDNALATGIGTVSAAAGALALSPLAIAVLARLAHPLPVGIRLAWRDLSRHRARSGLALAAISLTLGIPVAVAVSANAADATAPPGNVPEDQLLIWTRDPSQPEGVSPFYSVDPEDGGFSPYLPNLRTGEVDRARNNIFDLVQELGWSMVPLEVVLDPAAQDDQTGRVAVTLARESVHGYLDVALVYRATPQLLETYELGALDGFATTGPIGPSDIVTDNEQMWLANLAAPQPHLLDAADLFPSYTSLPGTIVSDDEINRRGWTLATVGWLLHAPDPVTDAEITEVRDLAGRSGLLVEDHEERSSLTALRWGATGTGVLVALAVLAMNVGLIRTESARDTRVLAATGATSTIRRTLTASIAGALAVLGALVGTLCAYIVTSAGYIDDHSGLTSIPALPLATIIIGVPLAATTAGWIAGGRNLHDPARQTLD